MNPDEFNKKWNSYLRERACGLEIDDEDVIAYLDQEFLKETISNPQFIYGQIKIKFGTTRIYTDSSKNREWELAIDEILKK